MQYEVLGVYLIDFKENIGGEISGKHYALVISKLESKDNTLLVAPITSKKRGKKYRGGFTIDCKKYQKNPCQAEMSGKDFLILYHFAIFCNKGGKWGGQI